MVSALSAMGLQHVVICPGSRNAPLVMALVRHKGLICHSATDERSAAFMALGMAVESGKPAAVCCTSGSAVLNLYPAIAEAYYMQVPLLLLTADRPPELIDRWDGQAIRQNAVFQAHVKSSFQSGEASEAGSERRFFDLGAQAVQSALSGVKGPVHINVPMREPLYGAASESFEFPLFPLPDATGKQTEHKTIETGYFAGYTRILILNGAGDPDQALSMQLAELNKQRSVVVLSDVCSGQHGASSFANWESLMLSATAEQKQALLPDLLISTGKMLLNKALRQWLKAAKSFRHLHIAENGYCADPFDSRPELLTNPAADVIAALIRQTHTVPPAPYYAEWAQLSVVHRQKRTELLSSEFNELLAVEMLLEATSDERLHLHLANSMSIRLAAYCAHALGDKWTIRANRGVSGIDGCTSTALGMALVNSNQHILISGDLAFFYDANAFLCQHIPSNLKCVVLNNHGGGIFRNIEGPAEMPEASPFLYTPHRLDASHIAAQYGLGYLTADSAETLSAALETFNAFKGFCILEVFTSPETNAKIFNQYKSITI